MALNDRHVLEKQIFPCLAKGNVRRLLIIGACRHSFHYPKLLKSLNITTVTVERDWNLAAQVSGGEVFHNDFFELETYTQLGQFDAILINGVLGYGIDVLSQQTRLWKNVSRLLKNDGLVIIGYRESTSDLYLGPLYDGGFQLQEWFLGKYCYIRCNTENTHCYMFLRRAGTGASPESFLPADWLAKDMADTARSYLTSSQQDAVDEAKSLYAKGTLTSGQCQCPCCGSNSGPILSLVDMYGFLVKTRLCSSCGIVYTNEGFDEKSLKILYSSLYRRMDRRNSSQGPQELFELGRKKSESLIDVLIHSTDIDLVASKLLEIGSGSGGLLYYSKPHFKSVLGYDFGDDSYLAYGRSKLGENLRRGGIREAINDLQQAGERCDVILYDQVLEHLFNPYEELQFIKTVLEPNGLLVVRVPNINRLSRLKTLSGFVQWPHLMHFSQATLVSFLASTGWHMLYVDESITGIFTTNKEFSETHQHKPTPTKELGDLLFTLKLAVNYDNSDYCPS